MSRSSFIHRRHQHFRSLSPWPSVEGPCKKMQAKKIMHGIGASSDYLPPQHRRAALLCAEDEQRLGSTRPFACQGALKKLVATSSFEVLAFMSNIECLHSLQFLVDCYADKARYVLTGSPLWRVPGSWFCSSSFYWGCCGRSRGARLNCKRSA